MTSVQLVEFVERKLKQNGIEKIIRDKEELALAYRLSVRSERAERIVRRELQRLDDIDDVKVPLDLEERVKNYLIHNPSMRWDEAVRKISEEK